MTLEPLTPDRRRAMTRQHLLDAAAEVFARQGFHGSTLDEVAKAAGFTKGAVYSNFTSKDDLFLALLDDRIDRQFSIVSEVLERGSHEQVEMRELIRAGGVFSDETWEMLYLEFVLYSRRHPEAAEKLAARAERERAFVERLIEDELAAVGGTPRYPIREQAQISLALFGGLAMARLVDPRAVTETTIDTVLTLLYDALGVPGDEASDPSRRAT